MTEKTFLTFGDRDDFNRKPIAEKIIKLLESDIDVSPLLIDGDWGTGKSEFCQKLINLMDKEKYHLVYVDAFKTDYMEEPLLALLAEIIKTCTLGEKTEKQVERRKELIKVLASVAKFGVKTVLKAGINFLLRQNVEELSEEWKGAVEEPIKSIVSSIRAIFSFTTVGNSFVNPACLSVPSAPNHSLAKAFTVSLLDAASAKACTFAFNSSCVIVTS